MELVVQGVFLETLVRHGRVVGSKFRGRGHDFTSMFPGAWSVHEQGTPNQEIAPGSNLPEPSGGGAAGPQREVQGENGTVETTGPCQTRVYTRERPPEYSQVACRARTLDALQTQRTGAAPCLRCRA